MEGPLDNDDDGHYCPKASHHQQQPEGGDRVVTHYRQRVHRRQERFGNALGRLSPPRMPRDRTRARYEMGEREEEDSSEEEEEEVVAVERPPRLVSFQRRLDRLQDRFGEALKRLAKPPGQTAMQAKREKDKRERAMQRVVDPQGNAIKKGRKASPPPTAPPTSSSLQRDDKSQAKSETVTDGHGSEESSDSDEDDEGEESIEGGNEVLPSSPAAASTSNGGRPPSQRRSDDDGHVVEDKVELDEEEEQESLLTAEGSHALPPSRVSNNKRALQAELGRLQRALEDERTKMQASQAHIQHLQDLMEMMEASLSHYQSLCPLLTRLGACTTVEEVMRLVGADVPTLLECDQSRLFLIKDKSGKEGGMVWTVGEEDEDEIVEAPISTGLVGEAAVSGRLINSSSDSTAATPSSSQGAMDHLPPSPSMVCVPLLQQSTTRTSTMSVGVVQCLRDFPFHKQEEAILRLLAQQLAMHLHTLQCQASLHTARIASLLRLERVTACRRKAQVLRRWCMHTKEVEIDRQDRRYEEFKGKEEASCRRWNVVHGILKDLHGAMDEDDLGRVLVDGIKGLMPGVEAWIELPFKPSMRGGTQVVGLDIERSIQEYPFKYTGYEPGSLVPIPLEGVVKVQMASSWVPEEVKAVDMLVLVYGGQLTALGAGRALKAASGEHEMSEQRMMSVVAAMKAEKEGFAAMMEGASSIYRAESTEELLGLVNKELEHTLGATEAALLVVEQEDKEKDPSHVAWLRGIGTEGLESLMVSLLGPEAKVKGIWGKQPKDSQLVRVERTALLDTIQGGEDQGIQLMPIYINKEDVRSDGALAVLIWRKNADGHEKEKVWTHALHLLVSMVRGALERFELQKRLQHLQAMHEEAMRKAAMSQDSGESLQQALTISQDRYGKLLQQLEQHEKRADELESELRRAILDCQTDKDALATEVMALRSELQAEQERKGLIDTETHRMNQEVASLHEQVFRQQAEINDLQRRNGEMSISVQAQTSVLDAAEKLLTGLDLEGLREVIPAVMRLVITCDRLEYRLRATAADLGALFVERAAVAGETELSSSPEALKSPILLQVMQSGSAAVRQLRTSDVCGNEGVGGPCLTLCVPLLAEKTKRVIGSLLIERKGEEARFSDRDMLAVTRLAPFISNILQRVARERMILQHFNNAGTGQKALRLLNEVKDLWQHVGTGQGLGEAFEKGVQNLLLVGRENQSTNVRCTLFTLDGMEQVLRGTSGEVIPLGVGTAGMVAFSGKAAREGNMVYVPIASPDSTGTCMGVARVQMVRKWETGGEEISSPRDDSGPEVITEEDVFLLGLFCRLLVPVMHHTQTMKTAFEGMKDASQAMRALQSKLEAAESKASEHVACRAKAEELLSIMERMHIGCRADSLVSLFRAAEGAAKAACGADLAALLLMSKDGDGRSNNGSDLWTLWPSSGGGERTNIRITGDSCLPETYAIQHSPAPLHIGPGGNSRFSLRQSWGFARAGAEQGLMSDGEGGEAAVLIVPVLKPGGGVYGVLEVVKTRAFGNTEEMVLSSLAKQLSTLLGWYRAELALGQLRAEVQTLKGTVEDQGEKLVLLTEEGGRRTAFVSTLMALLQATKLCEVMSHVKDYLKLVLGTDGVVVDVNQPIPKGYETGLEVRMEARPGRTTAWVGLVGGKGAVGTVIINHPDGPLPLIESNPRFVKAAVGDSMAALLLVLSCLDQRDPRRRTAVQGLDQQKQVKLLHVIRRWNNKRIRQALCHWNQQVLREVRSNASEQERLANQYRGLHIRMVQVLSACIDCMLGLGSGLEEDDADALLSDLEMLVREKLPSALNAKRCCLTLLKREEEDKDGTDPMAAQLRALSRLVEEDEDDDLMPSFAARDGSIVLRKPVMSMFNEAIGRLEVVVDEAAFRSADKEARLAELDKSSSLVVHFLGGLCSLVKELGLCKERCAEASHMAKLLEVQVQLYKEAAETAMSCEAMTTDASTFVAQKNEVLTALTCLPPDLKSLSRIVANQAAKMLQADAALYLVKRGMSRNEAVDGGRPTASALELQSLLPEVIHPCTEKTVRVMLEQCRTTGRRVIRRFLTRAAVEAHGIPEGDVEVVRDGAAATFTSGGLVIMCEPVVETEGQGVLGVILVQLPTEPGEEADKIATRQRALEWLGLTMASSLEGAELVAGLRRELAMEVWLEGRYRRLAEVLRYLYSRLEDCGPGPVTGDMTITSSAQDAVLSAVMDQSNELLGASQVGLYMCRGTGHVWELRGGRRRAVDAGHSVVRRMVAEAEAKEVWALPVSSLEDYRPEIDIELAEGDVMCVFPIRSSARKGALLGLIECALSPIKLGEEKMDHIKLMGKELTKHLAILMDRQRRAEEDAHHQCNQQQQVVRVPADQSRELGAWKGPQSGEDKQQDPSVNLSLLRDLMAMLLDVPFRITKIEDLMRVVSVKLERCLQSSRRGEGGAASVHRISVDLFALDTEGLWTTRRDGKGMLTVAMGQRRGVLCYVARKGQKKVVEDVAADGLVVPDDDLIGIELAAGSQKAKESGRVSLVCIPVTTRGEQGQEKVRGVVRYAVQSFGDGSGDRRASEAEQVLEVMGKILGGAITVLDSAVASKAVEDIYTRTEAALASAQTNLERSRDKAERVHGLCSCALLASLPLWWEPLPLSQFPGHGSGHVSHLAQSALSGILVLLNAGKAVLYLLPHKKSSGSNKMDVYATTGNGHRINHRQVDRPYGRGAQAGLLGRCIKKGIVINVADPRSEDRYNAAVDGEGLGSSPSAMLFLPLKSPTRAAIGVLQVVRDASGPSDAGMGPFTKDDQLMGEVFASHVSLAMSYVRVPPDKENQPQHVTGGTTITTTGGTAVTGASDGVVRNVNGVERLFRPIEIRDADTTNSGREKKDIYFPSMPSITLPSTSKDIGAAVSPHTSFTGVNDTSIDDIKRQLREIQRSTQEAMVKTNGTSSIKSSTTKASSTTSKLLQPGGASEALQRLRKRHAKEAGREAGSDLETTDRRNTSTSSSLLNGHGGSGGGLEGKLLQMKSENKLLARALRGFLEEEGGGRARGKGGGNMANTTL